MGFEIFSDDLEQSGMNQLEGLVEIEPGVTLEHIGLSPMHEGLQEVSELGAGTPEIDAENWHKQGEKNSCAVACQEFVAEQLLERDFSEQKMIEFATKKGWYDPEVGTTAGDVGKLLESMGLDVERAFHLTLHDLAQELDSGSKLICGVNNMILVKPELADIPGYLANHAVEVIGIEKSPSDTWVILNDPGIEGGRGVHIRAATFLKAWKTGNNYVVIARKGGRYR